MPAPWLSVTGTPVLVPGRNVRQSRRMSQDATAGQTRWGSHTAHQTEPGRGNTLRTRTARPSISLSYNPKPSTPLGFNARVSPAWGGVCLHTRNAAKNTAMLTARP